MKMTKLMLLMAVAVAAIGCQKSDQGKHENGEMQGGIPVTITAGVEQMNTRIGYDDPDATNKMAFHWTPGDQISLIIPAMFEHARFTTQSDKKSGTFSGTVSGSWSTERSVIGVFPHSDYEAGTVSGVAYVLLELPTTQTFTVGGNLSNSFMVAFAKATSETTIPALTFEQKTALVRLNITGVPAGKKVTKVELTSEASNLVTEYPVSENDTDVYADSLTKTNKLTVNVVNAVAGSDTKVDVALFPDLFMDVAGKNITLKVTVADEDGTNEKYNEITKVAPSFTAGKHYGVDFAYGEPAPIIEWATGNLIADGNGGCRNGTKTDGGLYFQFGSLVGWAGGATGDGTGVPASDTPGYAFNATGTVVPSDKSIPTTWGDPDRWTGKTGTVPAANDPCTHYLGADWRLPTTDEYVALFKDHGYLSTGPWTWNNDSKSATHTDGLTFPASGVRDVNVGSLGSVGTYGYCWSSSPFSGSSGYYMNFRKSSLNPSSSLHRAYGMPVRCVQEK